jgi:hypothetical protein
MRLSALKSEETEQKEFATQVREQLDATKQKLADYDQVISDADPELVLIFNKLFLHF